MKVNHSPTNVSENSLFYISSTESFSKKPTLLPFYLISYHNYPKYLTHQSSLSCGEIKKKKFTTKWAKLPNLGMGKGVKHHKLYLIFFFLMAGIISFTKLMLGIQG